MVLFGHKKRLGKVEREILESITAGDLLIGLLCSARSSRRMHRVAYERALARYRTRKTIDSLIVKGFATRHGEKLAITDAGRSALGHAINSTRASLQKVPWDGKWRVVAYDIPARYTKLRDQVRYVLKRSGFVKLHHSVWVFPHECTELTELIRSDHRLKPCVFYGVLDAAADDLRLRTHFGL